MRVWEKVELNTVERDKSVFTRNNVLREGGMDGRPDSVRNGGHVLLPSYNGYEFLVISVVRSSLARPGFRLGENLKRISLCEKTVVYIFRMKTKGQLRKKNNINSE